MEDAAVDDDGAPGGTAGETTPGAAPRPAQVTFTGAWWDLFTLVLKNSIFTLLTLGIYRFWAKTELRRYFWASSALGDQPFEYTGRGLELFLGFLVVIAILGPSSLLYDWTLGIVGMESSTGALLQTGYSIAILCLIHVAVYRIWRYRLSRTSWRGIRFGLDGSTWSYVGIAFGWSVLVGLTLGVMYPWARRALWSYRMNNARFGTTPMAFDPDAPIGGLVFPWLCALVFPGILFGLFAYIAARSAIDGNTQAAGQSLAWLWPFVIAAFLLWIAAAGWYRLKEFVLFLSHTRVGGEITIETTPKLVVALGLVILNAVVSAVILGAAAALATMAFVGSAVNGANPEPLSGLAIAAMAGAGLTVLIVLPAVSTLIFRYGLTRHIVGSIRATNVEALDAVAQSSRQGPTRAEGLADAFDVGAF